MLLVKARVRSSPIHGLGLFSCEFIPAGTVVWRYVPEFDVAIPEDRLPHLPPPAREQVLHYACYEPQHRRYLLSSDDDRFSNHSDDPNTRLVLDDMVAVRDIHVDDEITCDYRQVLMANYRPREHA